MHHKVTHTAIAGALLICVMFLAAITSAHSYAATRDAAIAAQPATVSGTCPATIREGSQGAPVTTLQLELNWIFDYQSVPIDGKFGAETDAAVRDFQSRANLPVNGIVDPTTWHVLGEC